jgi:23S rRNA (adenine2503-C2)-methyltransferase
MVVDSPHPPPSDSLNSNPSASAAQSERTHEKPHALNLSEKEWEEWFVAQGQPRFRAKEMDTWLFQKAILDPLLYTSMPAPLRSLLAYSFDFSLPTVDSSIPSGDGSQKILFKTKESQFFESVLMPTENRVTLCVSSQIGCKMACTFCQTGKMGFWRHLSQAQILGQVMVGNQILKELNQNRKITNVVFMGMGEPLDNLKSVIGACQKLTSPQAFGLSKHKVTVSTSGIVPALKELGDAVDITLAVSLHGATDAVRSQIMPINKTYPLAQLKEALLNFPSSSRHGITFEYILMDGVNDTLTDAKHLVKFLHGLKAKVNLIPMNRHPGSPHQGSSVEAIRAFQSYLTTRSIPAPVRYSKGQDISGACGQLAAKRKEELDLPPRKVALARKKESREAFPAI